MTLSYSNLYDSLSAGSFSSSTNMYEHMKRGGFNNVGMSGTYIPAPTFSANQPGLQLPLFMTGQSAKPQNMPQYPWLPQPQNQKVGFWEGLKAFGKGLFKPVVNMIKHPIKSALFIAGAAALIIGTGGAATPFLIAAGVTMGGYQVAKGAYKAITSETRQGTLSALEDMGEGTFTLGASVVGAKSYAASTSTGSATAAAAQQTSNGAKIMAYAKGLGQDTITVFKAVPSSVENSAAMMASGEFTGNLQSFLASSKLASQHRALAKMRVNNDPNYEIAKAAYDANMKAFKMRYGVQKPSVIMDKYAELSKRYGFDTIQENSARFANDYQLARAASVRTIKNMLKGNVPELNSAVGISSMTEIDPEIQQAVATYAPCFM